MIQVVVEPAALLSLARAAHDERSDERDIAELHEIGREPQRVEGLLALLEKQVEMPRGDRQALVGADDYGSTASTATAVGNLDTKFDVSGTIGSTTDQDYFRFTATATGQATFTLSGVADSITTDGTCA